MNMYILIRIFLVFCFCKEKWVQDWKAFWRRRWQVLMTSCRIKKGEIVTNSFKAYFSSLYSFVPESIYTVSVRNYFCKVNHILFKLLFVDNSCSIGKCWPIFYSSHLSPLPRIVSAFSGRQGNWWTALPGVRKSRAWSSAHSQRS